MDITSLPQFLKIAEVADLLRLSRPTVYKEIKAGGLPSVRLGGRIRVPREALLALLQAH